MLLDRGIDSFVKVAVGFEVFYISVRTSHFEAVSIYSYTILPSHKRFKFRNCSFMSLKEAKFRNCISNVDHNEI